MAFISQEKKKQIAEALKGLKLPKDVKYTLAIRHHMCLVITIRQAPAVAIDDFVWRVGDDKLNPLETEGYASLNLYHLDDRQLSGSTLKWVNDMISTVKSVGEWYDKSDSQQDITNVAFYIDFHFGQWDKPCRFVGKRRKAKAEPLADSVLARSLEVLMNQGRGGSSKAAVPPANEIMVLSPPPPEQVARALPDARLERAKAAMRATPVGGSFTDEALTTLAKAALGAE